MSYNLNEKNLTFSENNIKGFHSTKVLYNVIFTKQNFYFNKFVFKLLKFPFQQNFYVREFHLRIPTPLPPILFPNVFLPHLIDTIYKKE